LINSHDLGIAREIVNDVPSTRLAGVVSHCVSF